MSSSKADLYLSGLGNDIASPFFDNEDNLYLLMQSSGDIISINSTTGQVSTVNSTNGSPGGALFDKDGVLYIADVAHASVLAFQSEGHPGTALVGEYESKPLKGPSSIAYHSSGNFYFTDSGPFGETGLNSPTGSLFVISNNMLKPVSLNCLAQPSGVAVSYDGQILYVTEMMNNRILRYIQKPEGVFHPSVFYQFAGGVGPSCVTTDRSGNLYVGIYDIKQDAGSEGHVYVISKMGKLLLDIIVPGPEISGVALRLGNLYITEKSTGSIFRLAL